MVKMFEMKYKYTKNIPGDMEDGVLYISKEYTTAIHNCCCGCGESTVTPISSEGWTLTVNGDEVSLFPSIGNQRFPCKSHYWITNGKVRWV